MPRRCQNGEGTRVSVMFRSNQKFIGFFDFSFYHGWLLQPLKVHLEGHTPVIWVPNYSRLCMNQHLHWYLHFLEWGLLVTIFHPCNVNFLLRDPDLIIYIEIFTMVKSNYQKTGICMCRVKQKGKSKNNSPHRGYSMASPILVMPLPECFYLV